MASSSHNTPIAEQLDDTPDDIYTIEWSIENFSTCPLDAGQKLECPTSTAGNLLNTRWQLWIYPKGRKEESTELGYFVKRDDDEVGPESIHVEYLLYLVAFDGVKAFKMAAREEFQIGTSWGFYDFVKLPFLFRRKEYLLQSDTLRIGCKLRCVAPKYKQSHVFITEFPVVHISRHLTLFNYRLLTKQNPEVLYVGGSKRLLLMKVSLNKDESSDKQNEGASKIPETLQDSETDNTNESFLHIVMEKGQSYYPLHVSCCVKLLNTKFNVVLKKKISHLFSNVHKEEWTLPYFIDTVNLEDGCIDVDDTLYLDFDITLCDCETISLQESDLVFPKPEVNPKETTLNTDLENMLKDTQFSDVTLRIWDATFPSHKFFLAARSPRFHKIFTDLKKERLDRVYKTEEVEILDIDEHTMKLLLQFIYTDKLEDMDDAQSLSLYSAGAKYEISSLQFKCAEVLRKNLTAKQVHRVLLIAKEFADSEMDILALNFLLEHYKSVILTPEWQEFQVEHEELANQALRLLGLKNWEPDFVDRFCSF